MENKQNKRGLLNNGHLWREKQKANPKPDVIQLENITNK